MPAYLPSLPADPFATKGRPFSYSGPSANPFIYSVAENGTDDHASTKPTEHGVRPDQTWNRDDAVFHFNRRPKPAPDADAD